MKITAAQKKLPANLQKAIIAKEKKEGKTPAMMKKESVMKMKKAAMKLKEEEKSAMKMKKTAMKMKKDSAVMMKKAAMKMKKASAMKMKMKKNKSCWKQSMYGEDSRKYIPFFKRKSTSWSCPTNFKPPCVVKWTRLRESIF